jgi:hypothetical protein
VGLTESATLRPNFIEATGGVRGWTHTTGCRPAISLPGGKPMVCPAPHRDGWRLHPVLDHLFPFESNENVYAASLAYLTSILEFSNMPNRVDTKWRFQFFAKYDYCFLWDVIIAIIATFFAKAIIDISQLSLSISLE